MSDLIKLPAIHRPGKLPGHLRSNADGELPKRLTARQIEESAQYYLQTDCSNLRNTVLELLYEFVILTESTLYRLTSEQVEISEKSASFRARLNAYVRAGLIEPVSRGVLKQALRAGLPRPSAGTLRAYRLGPVGFEIAKAKFFTELNAPLVFSDVEDYQAHDLICAEAMLKMQSSWHKLAIEREVKNPRQVFVRGPRVLTIWDAEAKKGIVAPDGLIIKNELDGTFSCAYLVEYHNNNARMHVENKVAKYERLAEGAYPGLWQSWDLEEMPVVMVIYRQGATLQHYKDELNHIAYKGIRVNYIAVSLEDIWAGKLKSQQVREKKY